MRLSYLLTFFCLFAAYTRVHAQQQQKKQRVTAIVRYYHSGNNQFISDSTCFSYSGNRGSEFSLYGYGASYHGYSYDFRWESICPANVPKPFFDRFDVKVLYDTMKMYMQQSGGLRHTNTNYNEYADNGTLKLNVVTAIKAPGVISSGVPQHRLTEYDENGLLKEFLYLLAKDSTLTKWDTIGRRLYTYDDKKRIASDNVTYANGIARYRYLYADTSNNCIEVDNENTTGILQQRKEIYLRDGVGNVVEQQVLSFGSPPYQWDTAGYAMRYDGQRRLIRMARNSKPVDTETDTVVEFTWHYDATGKTDTVINYQYYAGGGMSYCNKSVFYYNEYGNPDSLVVYTHASCDKFSTIQYAVYYSYEVYTEEYPDTTTFSGPLVIFPNPAKDVVNIRWNNQRPKTGVYINIYSSVGQLVKRQYIQQTQPLDVVNMNGLASGIYFINIMTAGGGRLHTQGLLVN